MADALQAVRQIRAQEYMQRRAATRPGLGQFHFDHAQLDQLIQQPCAHLILGARPPLHEHHALGRSLRLECFKPVVCALGLTAA